MGLITNMTFTGVFWLTIVIGIIVIIYGVSLDRSVKVKRPKTMWIGLTVIGICFIFALINKDSLNDDSDKYDGENLSETGGELDKTSTLKDEIADSLNNSSRESDKNESNSNETDSETDKTEEVSDEIKEIMDELGVPEEYEIKTDLNKTVSKSNNVTKSKVVENKVEETKTEVVESENSIKSEVERILGTQVSILSDSSNGKLLVEDSYKQMWEFLHKDGVITDFVLLLREDSK